MAQKTNMRLLGVIENMTLARCSARAEAHSWPSRSVPPLLGTVPLDAALREAADAGEPLVWADPDATASRAIVEIAEAVIATEPRGRRRASSRRSRSSAERRGGDVERLPRRSGSRTATQATLADHFLDAERRGKLGHGLARVDWLATLDDLDPAARPERVHVEPGYERWDGRGALGYLTLAAICDALLADLAEHGPRGRRGDCFPTGMLGYWVRRLADGGLAAALTATSPPRLAHPDGVEPLVGTTPLAIGIPSSDGEPLVADVSMGKVTHGDVIAGHADAGRSRPLRRRAGAQGVRARGRAAAARRGARRGDARRAARRRAAGGRSRAGVSARLRRGSGFPATLDVAEQRREILVLLRVLAQIGIELERRSKMCDSRRRRRPARRSKRARW